MPPQEPQRSAYEQTQWAGMQYEIPPSIDYHDYPLNPHEKISEKYRPGLPLRIVKGIFYFLATFIIALGCFGASESFGYNSVKRGLALFFFFGIIIAGVVLFVYMRHRITKLRWGHFILWIVGATVTWFMASILVFAFSPSFSSPQDSLANFIFGSIFLLYGLVLATTALW